MACGRETSADLWVLRRAQIRPPGGMSDYMHRDIHSDEDMRAWVCMLSCSSSRLRPRKNDESWILLPENQSNQGITNGHVSALLVRDSVQVKPLIVEAISQNATSRYEHDQRYLLPLHERPSFGNVFHVLHSSRG